LYDRSKRGRRRVLAAALAFSGLALFVAAGAVALGDHRAATEGELDREGQLARVLPLPNAQSTFGARRAMREHFVLKDAVSAKTPGRKARRLGAKHMPRPVRISIPAIGVAAPIGPLDLNRDRTLQVPTSFGAAGWFRGAAEPGEPGPAIVVGHVDSKSGPAVFYRLRALRRGDRINIEAGDGSVVRYTVTSALAASKDHFPTRTVYGMTRRPSLRLITCDGAFNTSTGHYEDNYIVFAKWAGTRHKR
jgi:sortase (surface protein transpeptidase)